MRVEYNGWVATLAVDGYHINFYDDDDDCFLSIPAPADPTDRNTIAILPSRAVAAGYLRAYHKGREAGEKIGAAQARREIRTALGIERSQP